MIPCSPGNVGQELLRDPNLYISRDGGNNWEETLADSWGVSVADHGGLIVAAKDYHQVEWPQLSIRLASVPGSPPALSDETLDESPEMRLTL